MSEAKYIKINIIFFAVFVFFLLFLATSNISYSKSTAYVKTQYSTLIDEIKELINYVESKIISSPNQSEKQYIYSDCLNRLKKIKDLLISKNSQLSHHEERIIRHKILCIINEIKNLENSQAQTYIYTKI